MPSRSSSRFGDGLADERGGDGVGVGALHEQQARHRDRPRERGVAPRGLARAARELQRAQRRVGERRAEGGAQPALQLREIGAWLFGDQVDCSPRNSVQLRFDLPGAHARPRRVRARFRCARTDLDARAGNPRPS